MRETVFARSLVGAALAIALAGAYPLIPSFRDASAAAVVPQPPTSATGRSVTGLPDFTGLVQQNGPAVVNISVTQQGANAAAAAPGQPPGMDPDDPMLEFFKRFGIPNPQQQPGPQFRGPRQGLGSGFIVSSDGIILTNAHVVANAAEVTVRLTDKREYKAKVVGVDKPTDIAVLKIEARNLPTVTVATADDVKVGEWVVAIGSPYGFDNTVTAGIVSAKSRSLPQGTYVPFLQTDVAVNPGNSGGPLFNMKGEVVGINSQIYSRSGGYQGLSFAIPMQVAAQVKDQILAHGSVTRGRIGVGIQDVNQALAESFGLSKPTGALVSSVEDGGPAAKAGVLPGDVITAFNGQAIAGSAQLPMAVASVTPGTRATIEVLRQGAPKKLDITVAALEDAKKVVAAAPVPGADAGRLGLTVRPLDAKEQQQAGVKGGLRVETVSGPAARAGLRPGDVILSLNNTPVTTAEQLKSLMPEGSKYVALLVQREDRKIYVPLNLG